MKRGTTPLHVFTLPFQLPPDAEIRIVYAQMEKELVERTTPDCFINGNTVSVRLTDTETLRFNCHKVFWNGKLRTWPVEIQIGVKTCDGCKSWSDILSVEVERCLKKDGVI